MNTKVNTDTAVTATIATVKIDNSLVHVENNQAVVSSREIAEHFGKQHKNVLQNIQNLVAENSAAKSFFFETTYENRGKQYPEYLMNRDGFSLLVMGFTGKEALNWKIRYIEEFNRMEQYIRDQQKPKPMSHLEVTLANAQALVDHEKRIIQNTADIAELKKAIVHPFSRTNMAIASNTRKIKDHEERIVNLESFGEDKGPAEDLKSLISEAHRRSGQQISYQDLYMQFYTSLKDRFTVDIWARLRSLKARRKKEGWAKSKVDKLSTLDAITANPDIWRAIRQGIQLVRTQWLQEDTNREED